MTTFGKFVVGGTFIVIVLFAWFLIEQQNTASNPQEVATTTPQSSTIIPGVPDQTYTDSQLSFSMKYPATATSSVVDYTGYLTLTETPLVSFVLPSSMFEGTNLSEAGVYVGASSSPMALTSCGSAATTTAETSLGVETINGADFSVFTSNDAGAGNFYAMKTYRRIENGWCVELVELLHSTNIANYTPGTVKQFDSAYYQNILENIVHTYRSIPTGI